MRLSHLTALAVMIALVGAMFVAMGSVSADGHSVKVAFTDSDGIVADGTDAYVLVTAHVTLDATSCSGSATLNWIRVSGELDGQEGPENPTATFEADDAADSTAPVSCTARFDADSSEDGVQGYEVINPKGTTAGDYTVSAQVTYGAGDSAARTGSKVLKVGDAGSAVSSAELSLSTVEHMKGGTRDKATTSKGTPIYVQLKVLNSLGNTTDNGAVTSVAIIAAGGELGVIGDIDADSTTEDQTPSKNSLNYPGENDDPPANAVTQFQVSRGTAGKLAVYAVVVGRGGAATSNTLELTFTGDASAISLGEVSSPLGTSGSAFIDVTATDASGNPAGLGPDDISASIPSDAGNNKFDIDEYEAIPKSGKKWDPDAPADEEASATENEADDGTCNGTAADATDCDSGTTVRLVVTTTKASAGEHELEVTLGDDDDTQTATLIVAGQAAQVDVMVDESTVEVGDVISVTASVSDKDGNPVVNDDTSVTFESAGALKLDELGPDDQMIDLKNGTATVRFVVVDGSGKAIVVATYGKLSGTASVATAPVEEDAMPEEEASVACLSNLAGFATWACGVESSASEIFGLVSGRGATALHLWNGSAWVRYSVVDGTMVPGSSDFMVAENDILYISN